MNIKRLFSILAIVLISTSSLLSSVTKINAATTDKTTIYRMYNEGAGAHFYTQSNEVKKDVLQTWPTIWKYEGAKFQAAKYNESTDSCSEGTPVYQFWSDLYQVHFYAESLETKNTVEQTWPTIWKYEKVAYCAFLTQEEGTVPVYRFWSSKLNAHFFTPSITDRDEVIAKWSDVWSYENARFYAYEIDTTEAKELLNELEDVIIDTGLALDDAMEKYEDVTFEELSLNEALAMTDEVATVLNAAANNIRAVNHDPSADEFIGSSASLIESFADFFSEDIASVIELSYASGGVFTDEEIAQINAMLNETMEDLLADLLVWAEDFYMYALDQGLTEEDLNDIFGPYLGSSETRNSQRRSDVLQILNAVTQYTAEAGNSINDLGSIMNCNEGKTYIGTNGVNLKATLVSEYIVGIPQDPQHGTVLNTGYTICISESSRIQIDSPYAELGQTISASR